MCPMLLPKSLAGGEDQAKPKGIRWILLSSAAVLVIIKQKVNTTRCHCHAAAQGSELAGGSVAAPACDRHLVSGKKNSEVPV